MNIFFVIVLLCGVLLDVYFYSAIKKFTHSLSYSRWIFYVYFGITFLTVFFLFMAGWYRDQTISPPKFLRVYVFGFVFVMMISKLIALPLLLFSDLIKGIKMVLRKMNFITDSEINESRKNFLKKSAVIAAGVPFFTLTKGMVDGAFDYQVVRQKVKIPNLSDAFKGLKIVQISDMHLGSYLTDAPLKRAMEMINETNADVVFFTGDLVNEIAEEALPFVDTLKLLKAPLGIYAVLGNHDYGNYFYKKDQLEEKAHNVSLMEEIYSEMGWKLLRNESVMLNYKGEELPLIGVENWGHSIRFPKYGDLTLAMKDVQAVEGPKLLLSHDPSHWRFQVIEQFKDIALTFSGHTHGMQFGIDIPGFKWSPSKYLYPEWAGLYSENDQQIYVNRGLGFLGYPGRVGILPEITLIELT